jgi:hypothetical protein
LRSSAQNGIAAKMVGFGRGDLTRGGFVQRSHAQKQASSMAERKSVCQRQMCDNPVRPSIDLKPLIWYYFFMSERTAPPASRLYYAHSLEAEKVTKTEDSLYKVFGELIELSDAEQHLVDWARNEAMMKLKDLEIAHVALAQGIARNKKDYNRQEAAYQQEALEDAAAEGYVIEDWSQEISKEK